MVTGLRNPIPCLTKLKTIAYCSSHLRRKVVGTILLAGGLAFLLACQAVSTGNSGTTTAGQLNVTPDSLAVGNVVVGTIGTASGNVTAPGNDVTITAASTNNAQFSIGGISLPATIPSGQSIPFTVTFSPQVTGAATATLTFASSAQSSLRPRHSRELAPQHRHTA